MLATPIPSRGLAQAAWVGLGGGEGGRGGDACVRR